MLVVKLLSGAFGCQVASLVVRLHIYIVQSFGYTNVFGHKMHSHDGGETTPWVLRLK
jgi:hypothetical protein